jgi:peptide/nickel transport system ATP-binding protein
MSGAVLHVEDLHVGFHTDAGIAQAVNGVGFSLHQGERLGLVGESGSGKTTTVLALMRMIRPPGRIAGGKILLGGEDLLTATEPRIRQVRFAHIALIPQGAMSSLNPVLRVRDQIADVMTAHGTTPREADLAALLARVGLDAGAARAFPHELSGGMKQRVCIAMAIALRPAVLIADEPTSALDVVVQKQVLRTLGEVQREIGAAVILVGHDMGLMAQFTTRIGVMYAGRLVELGEVKKIFRRPLHPYTRMLTASLPSLTERRAFRGIPGIAPSLLDPPPGCPFHPRCPQAAAICAREVPPLRAVAGREVGCHMVTEDADGAAA